MTAKKPSPPPTEATVQADLPKEAVKTKSADLGLTERRRSVRPLPAPEAVESDGDTDWAAFQSLISDNNNT